MTPLQLLAVAFFAAYGCLFLWSAYEILTMPPDDERWEIVAEEMDPNAWDDWRL